MSHGGHPIQRQVEILDLVRAATDTTSVRGMQVGSHDTSPGVLENPHVECRGGLTANIFQELETLVREMRYDIIYVQETKWRHDSTWSNQDFHYLHSQGLGKDDRVAGLLIMISTRLVKAEDIQYVAIHPGRLLHARIPRGQSSVDLVNWYQYSVSDAEGVFERRLTLLTKLQKCIAGLPQRNSLLLAGDFNCPVMAYPPVSGSCVLNALSTRYQDAKDLQNVLRTPHLCVLNTWQRPRHGQLATFTFGDIASQIDFVIVRQRQADPVAKSAQILVDFPVGAWREGANHHPLEATVHMPRRLAQHVTQKQPLGPRFDQEKLIEDLRQPVPPEALQRLRQEAGDMVTGVAGLGTCLMQAAEKWYPRPPRPERRPDQPVELANSARHMWDIFRAQGIVGAWRVWVQFQKAHRIHKKRSKSRTKQRRDDLLEQAQQAARAGNFFGLWKVVKQLAPKAPRRRLQLNQEGKLLSPEEELQWIVQAYGERYGVGSAESAWIYEPQAFTSDVAIDALDLANILGHLSPRKAVPRNSVPPVLLLLKACCSDIATTVAHDVNAQWSQSTPKVRQEWSDASVALLPKAHGRSRTPLDWRPIGLQDCLGKSVVTLLLRQARQALVALLCRYPQTAYIPGRSTSTALRQVFAHCHHVREHAQGDRLTIHQRAAGQQPPQCTGGLQISLYLTLPLTWRGGTISRKLWTWRVSPLAYKTFYLFG
eukprot:s2334_g5.t1